MCVTLLFFAKNIFDFDSRSLKEKCYLDDDLG